MRARFIAVVGVLLIAGMPVSTLKPVLIHVDDNAAPGGNGSEQLPFDNLPAAL